MVGSQQGSQGLLGHRHPGGTACPGAGTHWARLSPRGAQPQAFHPAKPLPGPQAYLGPQMVPGTGEQMWPRWAPSGAWAGVPDGPAAVSPLRSSGPLLAGSGVLTPCYGLAAPCPLHTAGEDRDLLGSTLFWKQVDKENRGCGQQGSGTKETAWPGQWTAAAKRGFAFPGEHLPSPWDPGPDRRVITVCTGAREPTSHSLLGSHPMGTVSPGQR